MGPVPHQRVGPRSRRDAPCITAPGLRWHGWVKSISGSEQEQGGCSMGKISNSRLGWYTAHVRRPCLPWNTRSGWGKDILMGGGMWVGEDQRISKIQVLVSHTIMWFHPQAQEARSLVPPSLLHTPLCPLLRCLGEGREERTSSHPQGTSTLLGGGDTEKRYEKHQFGSLRFGGGGFNKPLQKI